MSILIKNIEMPKDGEMLCINIYPDGKVCINLDLDCKQIATAVHVPPHGRLTDADAVQDTVLKLIEDGWDITRNDYKRMCDILFECPTIIPAEEGE